MHLFSFSIFGLNTRGGGEKGGYLNNNQAETKDKTHNNQRNQSILPHYLTPNPTIQDHFF